MSIGMSFICIPSVGRNDQKPIFQLTDQNGRRKWLQLLGVVGPTAKHIFACQRHFSHQMRSSRGLHKWAVPDINLRLYSPAVTASRENEITDRHVSGSLVEDVQGVIEVGVEDFQPSFDSIIEIDSEILDSSADPVIELGVEDFLPIPFSPEAADSASTSNCELFEVEASFEKSLQSHQDEEDTPSSSLGSSNLVQTWANSRQSQTDFYLSDGTPRKRKYREELDSAKDEIKYLRNKVRVLENRVEYLLKEPSLPVNSQYRLISELICNLPAHLAICVKNCLKNAPRTPHGYRFDRELKTLALAVKFLSPIAFRYLKPLFKWPSKKTLELFVQGWPRNPGCNYSSLKALELRSRGFTDAQRYVSICCDEMSLKTNVQYERSRDMIIGLEDYGDENRTPSVASSVLTILVQGIGGNSWTHPLAYFFVHKSCKGHIMEKYIFQAIGQLQSIGLRPCQLVTDQGSNFMSFSRIVGVTKDRPFFEVNSEKIFYFFDSPHLLKSTRNCLENQKNRVSFHGRPVDWMHIIHVYEKGANYDISCTHKLTPAHVRPKPFNKMSVQLASQVFSNSVASAMFAIYSSGFLDNSESPSFFNTAEFVLFLISCSIFSIVSCLEQPVISNNHFQQVRTN
ncbi:PREDICTED: uncharacterized protein LOC108361430 [Rhagoletis zephyria]|uniref:uncharacterized protein LOC108361430 n=1 Tax=Rhagoletis zephyria TaxID=28612 RepID=UPI0008113DA3|nr:PREDICTED: uncharacterized protein LOC108361430 [Rhagoletis zephyria]